MTMMIMGPSTGPFADAVALYSQHLVRPPSASCPTPGNGDGVRRRPRSASAAMKTIGRPLPTKQSNPLAAAPRNEPPQPYPRSTGREAPAVHQTRPASAAAVGGALARPPPNRPSRPRPVTAVCTKFTTPRCFGVPPLQERDVQFMARKDRSSRVGHQPRRAVSAGGDSRVSHGMDQNVWNGSFVCSTAGVEHSAKDPAWRCDKESSVIAVADRSERADGGGPNAAKTTAAAPGSEFYYQHKNLGVDPEVMQKATEFVSRILLQKTTKEENHQVSTPSAQPQSDRIAKAPAKALRVGGCNARSDSATKKWHDTRKRCGADRGKDCRPRQGRGRKRPDKFASAIRGRSPLRRNTRNEVRKIYATSTGEKVAGLLSSRRGQQCSGELREFFPPRTSASRSTDRHEFPFPPGGTCQDLNDRLRAGEADEETGDAQRSSDEQRLQACRDGVATACTASNIKRDNPPASARPKSCGRTPMTPLAFDVFCSKRPTLLNDNNSKTRAKQSRSKFGACASSASTAAARGVVGSSNISGGGRNKQSKGPAASASIAPSLPQTGKSAVVAVACPWTSAFGTVVAGAERGRARAEVLKAAHRESLRKRRRRCAGGGGGGGGGAAAAAAAAAAATAAAAEASAIQAARACSTPGSTPAVVPAQRDADDIRVGRCFGGDAVHEEEKFVTSASSRKTQEGVDAEAVPLDDRQLRETLSEEVQEDTTEHRHDEQTRWRLGCDIDNALQNSDNAGTGGGESSLCSWGCPRTSDMTGVHHSIQPAPAVAVAPSPLFRRPFGGGSTRIGVNAPRSLQVCPGEHAFSGVASKIFRRCSSPRGLFPSPESHERVSQHSPHHSRPRRRRPSTACGIACTSALPFGKSAGVGEERSGVDIIPGLMLGVRPETAWSFFSKGTSTGTRSGRRSNFSEGSNHRGSSSPRWTGGDCLRRRVDTIADVIAKNLLSRGSSPARGNTRPQQGFQDEEEATANEHRLDDTADDTILRTRDGSNGERQQLGAPGWKRAVDAAQKSAPTFARDVVNSTAGQDEVRISAVRAEATAGQNRELLENTIVTSSDKMGRSSEGRMQDLDAVSTGYVHSADVVSTPDDFGSNERTEVWSSAAAVGSTNERFAGDVKTSDDADDGRARTPLGLAAPVTPASTAAVDATPVEVNEVHVSSRGLMLRGLRRPRSASAPQLPMTNGEQLRPSCPSTVSLDIRQSVNTTGLMQGGGHNSGQTLIDIVNIAEGWELSERLGLAAVLREESGVAADDPADVLQRRAPSPRDASDRGAENDTASRDTCGAKFWPGFDVDDRHNASREGGKGRNETGDRGRSGTQMGHEHTARRANEQATRTAPPAGAGGVEYRRDRMRRMDADTPATVAAVEAGSKSKPQHMTKASVAAAPNLVETPLDFRNATVKLKLLAAEAGVAVDGHEKAWGVSKERAEAMFNDLRFAAEEDAEQSGVGAALETRRRLHRILIESGLENSRRIEKEAALEEIRRVLRQDTVMYKARAAASERMLQEMRTLNAENDSCDMSALLECRRNRTLLMIQDRTEKERDQLRAACRKRSEEAAVMDDTLAEARHARGLLLGHTQHTVERLSCLAEYVSVTRRWCQAHLASRRHARVTSKALNLEFERKSKELDALLNKSEPRSAAFFDATAAIRGLHLTRSSPASTRHRRNNTIPTTATTSIPPTTGKIIANPAATHTIDTFDNNNRHADVNPIFKSDVLSPFETFRDASARLRCHLLSLSSTVSAAQRHHLVHAAGEVEG